MAVKLESPRQAPNLSGEPKSSGAASTASAALKSSQSLLRPVLLRAALLRPASTRLRRFVRAPVNLPLASNVESANSIRADVIASIDPVRSGARDPRGHWLASSFIERIEDCNPCWFKIGHVPCDYDKTMFKGGCSDGEIKLFVAELCRFLLRRRSSDKTSVSSRYIRGLVRAAVLPSAQMRHHRSASRAGDRRSLTL